MTGPAPDIKAIFVEALDLASDAERADYLDRACEGSPDVRARVEDLLIAFGQAGSFLEVPALARQANHEPGATEADWATATARFDATADRGGPRLLAESPGTWIGTFKLLQKIGNGGMGAVYMAEQEHPVRRRVALKII